jgi:hypothetical protein
VETSCHPEPLSKGAAIAKHSAPRFLAWEGVQWTGDESEYLVDFSTRRTDPLPTSPFDLAQGETQDRLLKNGEEPHRPVIGIHNNSVMVSGCHSERSRTTNHP